MLLPGDVRAVREPQAELDAALQAGAEPAPPGDAPPEPEDPGRVPPWNEWEPEPLGYLDPDDVPPTAAPATVVVNAPLSWAPIEPGEEDHRDFPDRRARARSPLRPRGWQAGGQGECQREELGG